MTAGLVVNRFGILNCSTRSNWNTEKKKIQMMTKQIFFHFFFVYLNLNCILLIFNENVFVRRFLINGKNKYIYE